ncbi:MAG: outer membrane protein multidrug efflux system [Verrucomicrobiota bacterium]|jgi:multidrug efflux system outer membrane protein
MKSTLYEGTCKAAALALTLVLLLGGGCAVGPDYHRPPTPEPAAFIHASAFSTGTVDTAWWRAFNDPILERLVEMASTNNYDFLRAQARLREARALWIEARYDFAPTVRSENSYKNSLASKGAQPRLQREERHTELYRAGFDATWELDLWGRVRRNVEAARATIESVEASRDDVLVSVRAEVAANYLELRGLQAQLGVARRNATNQADTLKLAEALRDGGQGTQLDVARSRSLLNATLATVPPLESNFQKAAYRIAVLCGRSPDKLPEELNTPAPLPAGPDRLDVGNPGDLLRRRPDVRAAERSLVALTARIGVEVADLFPKVTFAGTIGLEATKLSGLAAAGGDTWGFGPHLSWAAFDLGRVRQRIRAADARAEGALALYEQTVLLALEETENSLVTLGRERARAGYLRESERAGTEALELARQRYRDGIADFLSVLDAERTLLSLQEQLVTSETRTVTSLVALYKALGGGVAAPPVK